MSEQTGRPEPAHTDRAELLVAAPEQAATLAISSLQTAADHPDIASVERAIALLPEALRSAPTHPDASHWRYALATAYTWRARLRGDDLAALADYDRAVTLLVEAHPDPNLDPDLTGSAAAEVLWERFQRWCDSAPGDQRLAIEADRLVAALAAMKGTLPGREAAAYHQLVTGLAHAARYEWPGARASPRAGRSPRQDLDAAIRALATSIPELPADPLRTYAAARMLEAHRLRADRYDHPAEWTEVIGISQQATYAAADHPALPWLHYELAVACQSRAEASQQATDFAAAATCWQAVIETSGPDPFFLLYYGNTLRQRAWLTRDPADADTAEQVLDRVIRDPPDPEGEALAWYERGLAVWIRWQVTGRADDLLSAADSFDRANALSSLDEDAALELHTMRLTAVGSLVDHREQGPAQVSAADVARLRGAVADSRAALAAASVAPLPDRCQLALTLAFGQILLGGYEIDRFDPDLVSAMLALAGQLPDPPPGWSDLVNYARGLSRYYREAGQNGQLTGHAISPLLLADRSSHLPDPARVVIRKTLTMIAQCTTLGTGQIRGLHSAIELVSTDDPPTSTGDLEHHLLSTLVALPALAGGADPAALRTVEQRIQAVVTAASEAQLPPYASNLIAALTLAGQPGSGGVDPPDVPPEMAAALAAQLGSPPLMVEPSGPNASMEAAFLIFSLALHIPVASAQGDLPRLATCAGRLAELARRYPNGHDIRMVATMLSGIAEREVAKHTTAPDALRRAVDRYREVAQWQEGPQHPLWSQTALGWAKALRDAGEPDRRKTRLLGLSALAGHRWKVLLQSGTEDAIAAARRAAADARTVARWCLDDHRDDPSAVDDLISVLDAGRGLVLQSATSSRRIPEWLADAGHSDLASEWSSTKGRGRDLRTNAPLPIEATVDELPDDLRRRVLQALTADGAPLPQWLDAITATQIRHALAAAGADALVYLVPDTWPEGGHAVIVPTAGAVALLPLSGLSGDAPIVRSQATAAGEYRDAGPIGHAVDDAAQTLTSRTDALCRWAWSVAMRELVMLTQRWRLGRPARLVLIPTGALGLVPWHAAYPDLDRIHDSAITDLVCSYAASARMFHAATQRKPVSPRSSLVIGNPQGDLPFAGIEARAVHSRFYPTGTYLGKSGPESVPSGTPRQVLEWIRSASGPSQLHFACHGRVFPARPTESDLLLAGGRLTARELIEASRLAELPLARVLLAACATSVSGEDYDEAFSLATAFLAGGAHSVIGSLWPVPDSGTSLLMYLVHHYLQVDNLLAVDALHQAQRWMLDPNRRPPAGMPPELAQQVSHRALSHPVSWAGFTHQGR